MNKMKRFLAMFIATVMILGNVPAYALSKTGGAAKSEYLKIEKKAFAEIKNSFNKSDLGKLVKFTDSITGTYNAEVDLELEIPEMKTRKYVIKENGTYTDRYEDGVIEAYVENEKVASLDIIANDNLVSIRVPELYEKYLTIDMNDLAGLINKFIEDEEEANEIIETMPKGMLYNSDIMKIIKLTKAEEKIVKNASKKYAKLFEKELLKNENFAKEDNKNLTINNKSYKTNVASYTISASQLVSGLENVWKEFKNDTAFVNLIWGKIEALYNKMYEMNYVFEELPTKEQILGIIDYLFVELKSEADENICLKSTLYYQNGKLLRRDINTIAYDEETSLFSIYTVKDGKNEYYAVTSGDTKFEDFVVNNSKDTVHNFVVTSKEVTYEYPDTDNFDYFSFIKTETESIDKATLKITKINNNKYNMEFSVDGEDVKLNMEYVKNKMYSKEYDVSMNFDIISGEQNVGINTRLAYKKDIKLKKIATKDNEINLNEKSKEELVNLFEENKEQIIEKAQGKFLSAFYYDEIIKPLFDTTRQVLEGNQNLIYNTEEYIYDLELYN